MTVCIRHRNIRGQSCNGGGQLSGARGRGRHVHHARRARDSPLVPAMSLPPPLWRLPRMALDPKVLQMLTQPKLPLLGQFPPLRIPPPVRFEPIPQRRRASQWPLGQSARHSRRRLLVQRSPPSDGRRAVVLLVSTPCRSTTWADAIWVAVEIP